MRARQAKEGLCRWAEVTRRIQVDVSILELNDAGAYVPVEVTRAPDVLTGGVHHLRQGHQRRIQVTLSRHEEGLLPIVFTQVTLAHSMRALLLLMMMKKKLMLEVTSMSMGCVCGRSRNLQKPLDSYQELDLDLLKERWNSALAERREYLDGQIQGLMGKPDKGEADAERESDLISQWVALTEERNAVCLPATNSAIPGAPSDWAPPPGLERHIPVLYLNVNPEDMSTSMMSSAEGINVAGTQSILPKEHAAKMLNLPILRHADEALSMSATASWDSSIHEHVALNRLTPPHERVYAILKVVVRISHPAEMELVLRKRLCFNVYKRPSITERLYRKFMPTVRRPFTLFSPVRVMHELKETLDSSGILYDLVAHIPKVSLLPCSGPQRRGLLCCSPPWTWKSGAAWPWWRPGERAPLPTTASPTWRSTPAASRRSAPSLLLAALPVLMVAMVQVESILALDRLRQEVVISELLARQKRKGGGPTLAQPAARSMKRANSLPTAINAVRSLSPLPSTRLSGLRRNA